MYLGLTLLLACSAAVAAENAPHPAWQALDASLNEGGEHRREALAAIGTISAPDHEAVRRVEAALKDNDPLVRQTAALILGELKAESSIPKLQEALNDKGEVAFAAAKALAAMGDPSGRDFLIDVLAGERKDTRPGMVGNAVRKAKNEVHHPEKLVFMGAQDATGAMFGPVSIVFPVVKDTVDMRGKGAPGRAAAAAFLAKDPEPYAVALLEWGLEDDNEFVRIEAAKGLGQRGNAGSLTKLQAHLADGHNYVRDMVAAAMIRIQLRDGAEGSPNQSSPQLITKKP
jgi:HEAT repeat protein